MAKITQADLQAAMNAAVETGNMRSYRKVCCGATEEIELFNPATGELFSFCMACGLAAVASGVWVIWMSTKEDTW